ncbi:MAG: hypothetical protein K8S25_17420 [Alphaproteobacteria bacterium]|nr:hypothetical protein [Alphaproteobacteria bacterium]
MQTPQFAGLGVTVLVVFAVDLPIDWLVLLATMCGGLTTFVFTLRQG